MAARDPIDELMNSALEFERNEIASLDRFLAWFSRGTVDVQRDPGQPGNEVRVMTVHGAKGLEAPVVILADATADPARLGRRPITIDYRASGRRDRCPCFGRRRRSGGRRSTTVILDDEKRDLEEHMRLLYVALTRAADRLVVSGPRPRERKDGADPRPPNSWHGIVERALTTIGAEPSATGGLRYGIRLVRVGRRRRNKIALAADRRARLGDAPGAVEERPPRPLAPSAIATDEEAAPPPS